MTTLEIILIYVIIILLSVKPFKTFCRNGWSEMWIGQLSVAPVMWIIYTLIAIVEGYKTLNKKK